jgi:hypothetical protein
MHLVAFYEDEVGLFIRSLRILYSFSERGSQILGILSLYFTGLLLLCFAWLKKFSAAAE